MAHGRHEARNEFAPLALVSKSGPHRAPSSDSTENRVRSQNVICRSLCQTASTGAGAENSARLNDIPFDLTA